MPSTTPGPTSARGAGKWDSGASTSSPWQDRPPRPWHISNGHKAAGLRIVRQDFEGARAQASEAMVLCQELDDPRGIAWSLDVFAGLLAAGGHADRAARLWGASDALLQRMGGSLNPTVAWIRDRYFEPVKMSLGPGLFETAHAEGRAMSPAQAVALARQ